MRVIYLAPLWRYGRLKFFKEGSSRNRGRSVVGRRSVLNITLISYGISLRSAPVVKIVVEFVRTVYRVHAISIHCQTYDRLRTSRTVPEGHLTTTTA